MDNVRVKFRENESKAVLVQIFDPDPTERHFTDFLSEVGTALFIVVFMNTWRK